MCICVQMSAWMRAGPAIGTLVPVGAFVCQWTCAPGRPRVSLCMYVRANVIVGVLGLIAGVCG